ncbi:MAG: hypothetical protein KAV82_05495 [Phycisphaerae bacterium]|nr:hypothetical protein [Phycisphaerae bacterium]
MGLQDALVIVIVALAALHVVRRAWKALTSRSTGCERCCRARRVQVP